MIEVKNLVKKYGNHTAVKNISFKVDTGKIYGFLGPNGAGKSTTMNIMTGCLAATDGNVIINGYDIYENPKEAKKCIGYLPELPPVYMDMTPEEYLYFVGKTKGVKGSELHSQIEKIMEMTGITHVSDRLIKNLSKGYRQRVGLAQALVGFPEVIILDEPMVGLDPKQIIEIRTLIKKLGKSHTVILSSHILSEIQAVCDRIIIINKGVVAADGTADEIAKNITDEHKMTVRIEGDTKTAADKEKIISAIKAIGGIKYIRADMEREKGIYDYDIEAEPGMDIRRELNRVCSENGWNILMLQLSDLTLEDIFLKITVGEGIVIKNEDNDENIENPQQAEAEADAEAENGNDDAEKEADEASDESENNGGND